MGAQMSTEEKAERERSMAIDEQIRQDSRRFRHDVKVLLLGTQGSGKSTIFQQMKIPHGGYTPDELAEFRPAIYTNLVDLAKDIIWTMRKIDVDFVEEINRTNAAKILEYEVRPDPSFRLAPDVANAIESLWKDPIIATVVDHCSDPDLLDSATYFFSHVGRISQGDYVPCERDVVNARATTDGVVETVLTLGELSIRVFDVSNLPFNSESRYKWYHYLTTTTSVIFCAALSDYDQVLSQDIGRTRMTESLALFESFIDRSNGSVILFLTKVDVFKAKLSKTPLEKYFPEYTGGADANKAAKYILSRFEQANRPNSRIYAHFTEATDSTNARRIFTAIEDTLLVQNLKTKLSSTGTILENGLQDSSIL